MRRRINARLAGVTLGFAAFALAGLAGQGCHASRVVAPPPPLRAASASDFAVDVEFGEPLDRASAEDKSLYQVYPAGNPATPVAILRASMVDDTSLGRVIRLLIPDGLPDTSDYEVRANGVLTLERRTTGTRAAGFRTGLTYTSPLREIFAGHCDRCHGAARADGNYRTDSYTALHGSGTHSSSNLVAGDPSCQLVHRTRFRGSMFDLGGLSDLDSEIIRNWVVSYGARQ